MRAAPRLQMFTTVFLGSFIETLPFLPLGLLASAALHGFVSPERVHLLIPRSPVSAALSG